MVLRLPSPVSLLTLEGVLLRSWVRPSVPVHSLVVVTPLLSRKDDESGLAGRNTHDPTLDVPRRGPVSRPKRCGRADPREGTEDVRRRRSRHFVAPFSCRRGTVPTFQRDFSVPTKIRPLSLASNSPQSSASLEGLSEEGEYDRGTSGTYLQTLTDIDTNQARTLPRPSTRHTDVIVATLHHSRTSPLRKLPLHSLEVGADRPRVWSTRGSRGREVSDTQVFRF